MQCLESCVNALGGDDVSIYGQFCPVAKASEIFAERWTPLILRELLCGSHRFSELEHGLPRISRSLLAQRLRFLADAGPVERTIPTGKRSLEYHRILLLHEGRPTRLPIRPEPVSSIHLCSPGPLAHHRLHAVAVVARTPRSRC